MFVAFLESFGQGKLFYINQGNIREFWLVWPVGTLEEGGAVSPESNFSGTNDSPGGRLSWEMSSDNATNGTASEERCFLDQAVNSYLHQINDFLFSQFMQNQNQRRLKTFPINGLETTVPHLGWLITSMFLPGPPLPAANALWTTAKTCSLLLFVLGSEYKEANSLKLQPKPGWSYIHNSGTAITHNAVNVLRSGACLGRACLVDVSYCLIFCFPAVPITPDSTYPGSGVSGNFKDPHLCSGGGGREDSWAFVPQPLPLCTGLTAPLIPWKWWTKLKADYLLGEDSLSLLSGLQFGW